MTTQEPTRASLERAVDATRDAAGWYMEPPHRVTTSCMCGSCKALLVYGAACQSLGEHIGREAASLCSCPRMMAHAESCHFYQKGRDWQFAEEASDDD